MLCPWKPGEGIGSLWTKLQMLVTFHEGTEPRGNFPFTKVLPHKTILFKNYFFLFWLSVRAVFMSSLYSYNSQWNKVVRHCVINSAERVLDSYRTYKNVLLIEWTENWTYFFLFYNLKNGDGHVAQRWTPTYDDDGFRCSTRMKEKWIITIGIHWF